MTRVMYDSVSTELIPRDATAVALYVDGDYRNFQHAGWFKHANKLSIAVHAQDDAACLDVESGDATPAQAGGWVRRQLSRNQYKPVLYAARDNVPAVLAALRASGIQRSAVRIWSAHYGVGAHICEGLTCGAGFTADATQWTQTAHDSNLDESLLRDGFFPTAPKRKARPKVKTPPKPQPKVTAGTITSLIVGAITVAVHSAGLKIDPAEAAGIAAAGALAGGYFFPTKKGAK